MLKMTPAIGILYNDPPYSSSSQEVHAESSADGEGIHRMTSQVARLRKGSRGGRPPGFDEDRYKQRNTVERAINRLKQHRSSYQGGTAGNRGHGRRPVAT